MQLGNSIKLDPNADSEERVFLINTISKYINCISVMAKLVRARRRFTVKIEEIEK